MVGDSGEVGDKFGSNMRSKGIIYNAFVQTVLIYRSKRWVLTEDMFKLLDGFNYW